MAEAARPRAERSMSTLSRSGGPKWNAEYLRVAILTKDEGVPRKVAWITTGPGGIFIGVARATGWGTKYTYNTDGASAAPFSQRRQQVRRNHRNWWPNILHPSNQGAAAAALGRNRGRRQIRGFPFKRRYESVYIKPLNQRPP